jgi:hypothetical protein
LLLLLGATFNWTSRTFLLLPLSRPMALLRFAKNIVFHLLVVFWVVYYYGTVGGSIMGLLLAFLDML